MKRTPVQIRAEKAAIAVMEFIQDEFDLFDKCVWQSIDGSKELTMYGEQLYQGIKEKIEDEVLPHE